MLAARDSDEEFDVSNFFVTLPTVEEKANKRTDGRTDTPNYIVDAHESTACIAAAAYRQHYIIV